MKLIDIKQANNNLGVNVIIYTSWIRPGYFGESAGT